MNNGPRVFGTGDITIALSQDGQLKLFAGQTEIEFINHLIVKAGGVPRVEVHFLHANDAALELQIDANARALAAFPWVRVIRE